MTHTKSDFFVRHELKESVEVYGQKFGPTLRDPAPPPPATDVTDT